jgi:methionyl-tRNA formyltransferase
MRLAVLVDGAPNQMALCHALAGRAELVGIVVSANASRRRAMDRAAHVAARVAMRLAGDPFAPAWRALQDRYHAQAPAWPDVPIERVSEINAPSTLEALSRWRPDLVAVAGTNLVGRPLIEWAAQRRGVINLHTGVSPYLRGGPNCTNWCLAEGTIHLIGNTVLWLDAGVDSGAIITSARTPLTGRETLEALHWAVMQHAHALYASVVEALAEGRPLPRVPQAELGAGRLFRNRDWTVGRMRQARQRFARAYGPALFADPAFQARAAAVRVVPLEASDAAVRR